MSRRLRLGMLTVFAGLCAVAFTVFLLYAFSRPGLRVRWDLTTAEDQGLSDRTTVALQGLPEGSTLSAFLFQEDPELQKFGSTLYPQSFILLRSLVDDAAVRSGGTLSTLILDEASPLVAIEREMNRLERQPGETLILEVNGNRRVLAFEDLFQILRATPDGQPARLLQERVEAALGDAAIALTAGSIPRVAVVVGYGQGSMEESGELFELGVQLQRENWEVFPIQGPEDAADADLIVIPGQRRPFLPSDAQAMADWILADKPVLLALGPNAPPDVTFFWNDLLKDRGTGFDDGLVCEPLRIQGGYVTGRSDCAFLEIQTEQLSPQHSITVPLIEASRLLLFRGARPLKFESGTNDFTQERLVRSGSIAWIEDPRKNLFEMDPGEIRGVVPLAVAAERWAPGTEGRHGRVVLLGSAESIRSDMIYNRELLAGSLQWLSGQDPKERGLVGLGELPFRPQREVMIQIQNIGIYWIPGLTFLIGFLIYWKRKR
ncbi:MAG: hypothetical protein O3A95_10580 [Planctomycetota bacterium]|nr:hypothetical protein [Planctomycetota bacterium]